MTTFHHIISLLKDQIVSYQLPFNQFELSYRLIFADENHAVSLESESFIFCDSRIFSACLSQPFPRKSCFFIACHKDELPAHIPHSCNYIACSLPYPVLCTRILQIYQDYEHLERFLSRPLRDHSDIKSYLNSLSELTHASCCLYDEKYDLLLNSDIQPANTRLEPNFLSTALNKNISITTYNSDYGYYSHLKQQTFHNRTFYLHITSKQDFSELDINWILREALNHILNSIANYNISFYPQKELAAGQFVREIMDGTLSNWGESSDRYYALASAPSLYTTAVYILTPDSMDALNHVFFRTELATLFPDCVIGPYENDFVIFYPNPDKKSRPDLNNIRFNQLLEKYDAYAGCSLWTKFRFRTLILLARSNAVFGKDLKLEPDSRIFYHNDYSFYHLIDLAAASYRQVHHSDDLTYLQHPGVLLLNSYDRDHNTNMLEVLYTYLINGCSVNETAAALNMHRNTVQSKINKLNELIRDDFTHDGLLQCHLLLSCMLFFYQTCHSRVAFRRPQAMQYSFKNYEVRT